jgi:hypothetical protein
VPARNLMKTQQQELEDNGYDNEWGQPAASTDTPDGSTPTSDSGLAAAEGAFGDELDPTPNTDIKPSATSDDDDVWAGVSDKAKAEFQKTQNEYKAQLGRTRAERERNTRLEQEHTTLKNQLSELETKNRKPSQFEQDHPDYAEEVKLEAKRIMQTELASRDSEAAAKKASMDEESAVNTILATHADAGEIWNAPEFQTWINEQPQRVNQQLNSSNPEDTITVLNDYKSSISAASKAELNLMSDPKRSSSKPDNRGGLTFSEQYSAEWETDD